MGEAHPLSTLNAPLGIVNNADVEFGFVTHLNRFVSILYVIHELSHVVKRAKKRHAALHKDTNS